MMNTSMNDVLGKIMVRWSTSRTFQILVPRIALLSRREQPLLDTKASL